MSELKPRITENGIDYILVGDYYIPDLKLPEEHRPIGKYGRLHREYLREIHPARSNTLTLTGELWTYLSDRFYIASAATSTEEIWNGIGNPVYPPAREELAKHGIDCKGKRAVQLTKADYDKYDYILGMDYWNLKNMLRILKSDPEDKVKLLLDYSDDPRDIADPWYTGGFDVTYSDVVEGCEAFLEYLKDKKKL